MKRFRVAFITAAVLANVGIGVVTAVAQTLSNEVKATTRCTTESLKGDFAFAGQGFLARAPLAFVGVLHFDGKGRFSGRHEESVGGNYGPSVEAGDYSVEDDCIGVTHWTDHPPHTGLPPHNHTIKFVWPAAVTRATSSASTTRRPDSSTRKFRSPTSSSGAR